MADGNTGAVSNLGETKCFYGNWCSASPVAYLTAGLASQELFLRSPTSVFNLLRAKKNGGGGSTSPFTILTTVWLRRTLNPLLWQILRSPTRALISEGRSRMVEVAGVEPASLQG